MKDFFDQALGIQVTRFVPAAMFSETSRLTTWHFVRILRSIAKCSLVEAIAPRQRHLKFGLRGRYVLKNWQLTFLGLGGMARTAQLERVLIYHQ